MLHKVFYSANIKLLNRELLRFVGLMDLEQYTGRDKRAIEYEHWKTYQLPTHLIS